MIRSLWELHQERLGFDPDVVARIFTPSPRYDDPAAAATIPPAREAAAGVPGVKTAAVANRLPVRARR